MAVALPFIMAAGAAVQGVQQTSAADANAATYGIESKVASTQGYEAEAQQRREGAEAIGRSVTAAGQSGGGYGGSTGRAIGQSALNANLDALNIRYKAQLQKWGFGAQSQNLKDESAVVGTSSIFKAGAQLLRGYGNYMNPGPDLG